MFLYSSKYKKLRFWLKYMDAESFVVNDNVPSEAPEEVVTFARRLKKAFLARYKADILNKQMEYNILQSQINPHFLYNTLEAIRSEAIGAEQFGIAKMTEKLSRFFRYSISSRGDFVSFQDEIVNVQDYLYIQQYRFGDRFKADIRIEDDSILRCHLPKMTLQPIVENAIHHGLELKKGSGLVTIRSYRTEEKLYIWISDDGLGMSQSAVNALNERLMQELHRTEANKQKGSIALENVNARIQLYFGVEYGVRVSSLKGVGTDVEIVLPYLDELGFAQLQASIENSE